MLEIATKIAQVRERVKAWKKAGLTVGLVPTMGYLHEGHASLVKRAKSECDRVVVSDFVNPTQFGPNEDLESYPRDFERDCALLKDCGADLVFHPAPEEMYAPNRTTWVDMERLSSVLCGKTRPIHFRGVCTVVNKLINIAAPDRAYFGQKDAQQLAVIRRMVRDLNMDVVIVGCPIVREEDGLAKSSRNTYLSAAERQAALCLSRAVRAGERLAAAGASPQDIVEDMKSVIQAEPMARIDYVEAVDAVNLEPVTDLSGPVLFAMAVYIGRTRLIDNFITKGTSMQLEMLKAKIHRATVTQAELDYVGSITVDADLLRASGILEYEKVQIVDIMNGARFETYTIAGEAGSGVICLNGAAARCVATGDKVIIMSYARMSAEEAASHRPCVVFVDDNNRPVRIAHYEKHGKLLEQETP